MLNIYNKKQPINGEQGIQSLWPVSDTYTIHPLSLYSDCVTTHKILHSVRQVCLLADLLRSHQSVTSNIQQSLHLFVIQIQQKVVAILENIKSQLSDPDSIKSISLRQKLIDLPHNTADLVAIIASLRERQLISFFGDLSTWHSKSTQYYSSAFFAIPELQWQGIIDKAETCIHALQQYLQATVSPSLKIIKPAGFIVSNLICAGGEANTYPKHYAYFMPEDEGIKKSKIKRTITFLNVYHQIFNIMSKPFALTVCNIENAQWEHNEAVLHQLLWFRGHDIGHFVQTASTSYRVLGKIGRWQSMAYQEVQADVFGYLLMIDGPWKNIFRLSEYYICAFFMSEMLRYMRRGVEYFPDATAAGIEFIYLLKENYIKMNVNTKQIISSVKNIRLGLQALAKTLVTTILSNDLSAIHTFNHNYGIETNKSILKTFYSRFGECHQAFEYII